VFSLDSATFVDGSRALGQHSGMTLRMVHASMILLLAACSGDHDSEPVDEPRDAGPVDDAGSDASDDAGTGALSDDAYLAACARVSACEPEGVPLGLGECLWLRTARPNRFVAGSELAVRLSTLDCQLAAPDCESMKACAPDLAPLASTCTLLGSFCSGNTLVLCGDDGPTAAVDCAKLGQICGDSAGTGNAACGHDVCQWDSFEKKCDGNTLVRCNAGAGVVERVDCTTEQVDVVILHTQDGDRIVSLAGEVCGIDQGDFAGEPNCIGQGEPCHIGADAQSCEGPTLTTCAGGLTSHRDCSALLPSGMGCGFTATGLATCGPVGSACQLDDNETCEDGTLGFCGLGGPATLDCKALGYRGCKKTPVGERTVASCTR
jgi:hypothetical protein